MYMKQLSVFIENSPGRLRAVTSVLAEKGINMRALALADTSDFGILRLIVDKPEIAIKILKEKDFTVNLMDVIGVEMDDSPGGLDVVLNVLEEQNVNIEYMYAFMSSKPKKALVILRVDKLEDGIKALKDRGLDLIGSEGEVFIG